MSLPAMGQAKIIPDHARSKWNHAFLLGKQRGRAKEYLRKLKLWLQESEKDAVKVED